MRIDQYHHFHQVPAVAPDFAARVAKGDVIDVSPFAARIFGSKCVGVDATTYERFVEWSNAAMRRFGVHLDQRHRLETLLDAGCYAALESGGSSFVCRAVDAMGFDGREQRHVLSLRRVGSTASSAWLITC